MPRPSKHQIEELKSQIYRHYVKRFKRNRIPKYGALNKGFTERELQAFLNAVDDRRLRLLFSYQAYLGLRIGEAVKVNIRHMNLETRELAIKTEKARTADALLIPQNLFKDTVRYIEEHATQIESADGYVFFKDERLSTRDEPYICPDYVRHWFRYYIQKANLDETYEISDEAMSGRRPRQLHRLTTHSLRHYAITRFSKQTNGNLILTSKFARHSRPDTTMTYINTTKEELYREIDGAFSMSQATSLKAELARP